MVKIIQILITCSILFLTFDLSIGYLHSSSVFPMRYARYPQFQPSMYFNRHPFNTAPCNYYPRPAYVAHQWASFCADLRLYQRADYLISRLNLTQSDLANFTNLAENWDIEGIRNAIYNVVNERLNEEEKNETLRLIDELGPPVSFTDALEAFTVEQKAQVLLLFKNRRYHDIAIITNGIIASLPDEDQAKARRFIQAIHYFMK